MHICASDLTTIGWDNGLSPGRRQSIISNSAGILLIGTLGINLNEILLEINIFSLKIRLKMSCVKLRIFRLRLNVLIHSWVNSIMILSGSLFNLSAWRFASHRCRDWHILAQTLTTHTELVMLIFNTLSPRQNYRHFADDILEYIFLNENIWISINIHWSMFIRIQTTISDHWFRW